MNSIETTIQQQLPWCDDDPMVVGYFLCFLCGTYFCFITVQSEPLFSWIDFPSFFSFPWLAMYSPNNMKPDIS